jgi:hypothetical protein
MRIAPKIDGMPIRTAASSIVISPTRLQSSGIARPSLWMEKYESNQPPNNYKQESLSSFLEGR